MYHIALPSKGNVQTLFFWIGLYLISLAFAVFIGFSIFYSLKSQHIEFNKKKTSQQHYSPRSNATLMLVK